MKCLRIPQSTPPSHNIPPPSFLDKLICAVFSESTPPSQNIPPFSTTIILYDAPRMYPSLPEYTPFSTNVYVQTFQNLPLPPKIYPLFNKCLYATLPESTPPSQNISSFQQLYVTSQNPPFLPEYTPLFNNYNTMRHSQNLPLLPKIYLSLFNYFM